MQKPTLYLATISSAPNPRRVTMFLREAGIDFDQLNFKFVDMAKKEHKSDAYIQKNPSGKVPVLELPDGSCISESVAICRYFDKPGSGSSLFGNTPKQSALIEMWGRRLELEFLPNGIAPAWFNSPVLAKMLNIPINPKQREKGLEFIKTYLSFLNDVLSKQEYIAGDTFSVADITGFCWLDFCFTLVGVPKPDGLSALYRWFDGLKNRPSANINLKSSKL